MASERPASPAAGRAAHARALAALLCVLVAVAAAAEPVAGSARALRAAWARVADGEGSAPAAAGPVVTSAQSGGTLTGSLWGVLDARFADVAAALAAPRAWCEVLILDPNVHRCRMPAAARYELAFGQSGSLLALALTQEATADYLRATLVAPDGPFGTRDYTMTFAAAPLADGRTVVQLAFAQHVGLAARLALAAYFNTVGRAKVGFTVVGGDAAGGAVRVGDLRGGVERNLVRQWLALAAVLDTRARPGPDLAERRVRDWLAGTARYPLQLREEDGYLARKVPEVRRQLAEE